jgi:phage recombination protein Bet
MTTTRKKAVVPAAVDLPTQPDTRLAVSAVALDELGLDAGTWRVLTESIFPSARTAEGVLLAVRYCRARNLDVMRRPVHVVPMWSKALGREVETVWPGIAEVQTTAARTGEWVGMDPPRFGPDVTRTFQGRVKNHGAWEETAVTVTYPAWCEVTVYRMVQGTRCPFSEPVFWEETYARAGGTRSEVPTDMWVRRPRGQLLKCAKAASLRAAFPEEADYTAEEMAGKVIDADGVAAPGDSATRESAPAASDESLADAPADDAVVIAQEVREQVERLILRAAKVGAWGQAEAYCQARLQGPPLRYALRELAKAQAEALSRKAERQAA